MKPIVFPKAGKIMLIEYGSDGSLTFTPDKMTTAAGLVESVVPSVNSTTVDLEDGNSEWPAAVFETGKSGEVRVNMKSFQPGLYARLVGDTADTLVNEDMWEVEEELAVASASPFSATLKHAHKANGVFVMVTKDNSPFTVVTAAPAPGQVSVSGVSVTFNSTDAGKEVLATYQYTVPSAVATGLPGTGNRKVLHAIFAGEASTDDNTSVVPSNIVVDKCMATGEISPPPSQKDPTAGWSFTLRVLKPRAGRRALDIKTGA